MITRMVTHKKVGEVFWLDETKITLSRAQGGWARFHIEAPENVKIKHKDKPKLASESGWT